MNLGLAIDVPTPGGRSLVVPAIKRAEALGFREFHAAYEDLVARGREGKLTAADFQDTTVTLTNPGGFGTGMSVPRLMKGQGLIIATGSVAVSFCSPKASGSFGVSGFAFTDPGGPTPPNSPGSLGVISWNSGTSRQRWEALPPFALPPCISGPSTMWCTSLMCSSAVRNGFAFVRFAHVSRS